MRLTVYLAGEIHSSWREEVKLKVAALNLPIDFVGPMEDHDRSDNIGEEILGKQPNAIFKDAAASSFNNLRTEILMKKADLVIAFSGKNTNNGTPRWMQVLPLHSANHLSSFATKNIIMHLKNYHAKQTPLSKPSTKL